MRKQISDQNLVNKVFIDKLTLDVTSVTVNDE